MSIARHATAKDNSLLTNTNKKNENLYKMAIKKYEESGGKLRIFILPNAFDDIGRLVEDYISIHTKDRRTDHGEFWRMFEKVERYEV